MGKYIDVPEAIQLNIIKENLDLFKYIDNPKKYVQLYAVSTDPSLIRYINNPDIDVQIAAVEKGGYSIIHINSPSKKAQLCAIKKNPSYLYLIKPEYIDLMAFKSAWENPLSSHQEMIQFITPKMVYQEDYEEFKYIDSLLGSDFIDISKTNHKKDIKPSDKREIKCRFCQKINYVEKRLKEKVQCECGNNLIA